MATRNMNATQQQAVLVASIATELALEWYGPRAEQKELDARTEAGHETRREQVLKLALETATAGEVSIRDGTPVQQLFLTTFAKEVWKAAGLKGNANTAIKKDADGQSLGGLAVITSNIRSIFLAANIGASRLLTEKQGGISENETEWDVHAYLQSLPSWAALYAGSVKVRRIAHEYGMVDKAPSSNRGGKSKSVKVKTAVDALTVVSALLKTPSEGRQLVREALRCFVSGAHTVDARTALQRITDEYLLTVDRYLEPIRNETGKPAKQQINGNASAASVAAPLGKVAPDAPGNDQLAVQFAQFQAFLSMQAAMPGKTETQREANIAAFNAGTVAAKDEVSAAMEKRGVKAKRGNTERKAA